MEHQDTPPLRTRDAASVLLIEDDPGDAALIQWQLESLRARVYRVHRVDCLQNARLWLDAQPAPPDVVLLDLNLPDCSGLETIRTCQTLTDAPIVVLTGMDDESATQAAIESGAEDYLAKGGPPALLHRAISYAMLRHRREADARLAATVFTHAREGVMIANPAGALIDVNTTFTQLTGYSREEAIGKNPRFLKSGNHPPEFYQSLWQQLLIQGHWYGEIWNRRKSGEVIVEMLTLSAVYDARGRIRHFVGMFSDITLQKEHERQLELKAHHDALTGLPNRILLGDRLQQAMMHARRTGRSLVLAYIDLDGFKAINDGYGHQVGDRLLVSIAEHMRKALREGDTIARLGGDEFVAVLSDQDHDPRHSSLAVITRLLDATSQPVEENGLTLRVSGSIGLTFYPQGEEVEPDQLLRQADQAMYQAKQSGKNRYCIFDADHERSVRHFHESVERIRLALERREFLLYYQPKVNMRSGQVVGLEALIRWNHPDRGLLSPAAFLTLVEGHPLEHDLGTWVLDEALSQMEAWYKSGLEMPVSVNISARQLQNPHFAEQLRGLLNRYEGLPAQLLSLEVLETSALADVSRAARVMQDCSRLGVSFALDDFGTGYSSLTYLKRLPVDMLKIDQSFIRDMLHDPDDFAILEGVIGLAGAFHRVAIAEGVETEEHGLLLLRLGCELAQGYWISRPMPPDRIRAWLKEWASPPSWRHSQRWPHEALPALAATVEHRAWLNGLQDYLRGKLDHPPTLDPHRCRLGTWLDQTRQAPGTLDVQVLERLRPMHEEMHTRANDLILLRDAHDTVRMEEQLKELHGLKGALLSLLSTVYPRRT